MVINVYSVFDRLAGCYKALGTDRSDARATRTFLEEATRSKLSLDEFEFHKLGTFDDEKGLLTPIVPPVVLPLSFLKEE